MKKYSLLIAGFLMLTGSIHAAAEAVPASYWNYYNGQAHIFVEGGVEFSVFPDGQFDFVFVGPNRGRVNVRYNTPGVSISFNAGYDYDRYVQYDDYGAVIQIENVPIYYDHFGRIVQAGNVLIHYNNRRIVRIGGYNIFYDRWGFFDYGIGAISVYYPRYIYRPWHVYYARPWYNNCVVYDYPYRQFYRPHRYEYAYHRRNYNRGRRSYANGRREFHRPGSRIHYEDGRVARNNRFDPNRENTMVSRTRSRNTISQDRPNNSRGIARKDASASRNYRVKSSRDNSAYVNGGSRGIAKKNSRSEFVRSKPRAESAVNKPRPNTARNRPAIKTRPSTRKVEAPSRSRMSKASRSGASKKVNKANSNRSRSSSSDNRSGRQRSGRKINK